MGVGFAFSWSSPMLKFLVRQKKSVSSDVAAAPTPKRVLQKRKRGYDDVCSNVPSGSGKSRRLEPKRHGTLKQARKAVLGLLAHNSNSDGGSEGFRNHMQNIHDLSKKLPGKMSAKFNYMLGAIERNCYRQLKTPGKYRIFCPVLLAMSGASHQVVEDAKERSNPWGPSVSWQSWPNATKCSVFTSGRLAAISHNSWSNISNLLRW